MDNETAKYIINNYFNLLTGEEMMSIKHMTATYKLNNTIPDNTIFTRVYKEWDWLTSGQNPGNLLKDGYEQFELNVANRILAQNPDKVYLNKCLKCNRLARTPSARQCRFCGYSWHDLTVGQFKLESCFQLTGRQFFLLGQLVKGEIKKGQFMDLTMLGISKKPKIEAIEFALNRKDGEVWEDIGLGTNELTENEKEFIKNKGSLPTLFDIIKER